LDQLWWASSMGMNGTQQGPTILAWTTGPELAVTLGGPAKQVGQSLHIYPAPMSVVGPTVFPNALMGHAVVASEANDASDQGSGLMLGRGTMTVEWRPLGYGGPFRAS